MTTVVKVLTEDRPAMVTIDVEIRRVRPDYEVYGEQTEHQFLAPHSEHHFTVYNGATLQVEELPEGQTSLEEE